MSPLYDQRPSYGRLIATREAAAAALYRAEIALYDAESSGVAKWIEAAHYRLQLAARRYDVAAAEVVAQERRAA
jgi:hypothetical protein